MLRFAWLFLVLAAQAPVVRAQAFDAYAPQFNHRCQTGGGVPKQEDVGQLVWYRCKNSNTVVVFVHGFDSNNINAWKSETGYWPEIVAKDPIYKNASIVLAPFYTNALSADYLLNDASRGLWSELTRRDPEVGRSVLDHTKVLFVTHSTGGVLIRHVLERNLGSHPLKMSGRLVGLMLLASPSQGSKLLVDLDYTRSFFAPTNRMLGQLAPNSEFLNELSLSFQNLVARTELDRGWAMVGQEFAEGESITCEFIRSLFCRLFSDRVVVARDSALRFFPDGVVLPNRNHISISKPLDANDPVHRWLNDFYRRHFLGNERAASIPIPFFYSMEVLRSDLGDGSATMADTYSSDKRLTWTWTVIDGKCFDESNYGGPSDGCTKVFDRQAMNISREDWGGGNFLFCSLRGGDMAAAGTCAEGGPPPSTPQPDVVKVAWNSGSNISADWGDDAVKQFQVTADQQRAKLFQVTLAKRAPAKAAPVWRHVNFYRYDEYSESINRESRSSVERVRLTVFPDRVLPVSPGNERDDFKAIIDVRSDQSQPLKIRYRPRN